MKVRRYLGCVVIFRTPEELDAFRNGPSCDVAEAIDGFQLDRTDHLAEIDDAEFIRLVGSGLVGFELPAGVEFLEPDRTYRA
jgi:hypothetical protein